MTTMRTTNPLSRAMHALVLLAGLVVATSGGVRAQEATPAAGAASAVASAASSVRYRVYKLPTLGGDEAAVVELNNAGLAVGWSELRPGDDASHATLWAGGQPVDLGTLGGPESTAADLNDDGVIVGIADTPDGKSHAVIWRDGVIADLGTLGGEESAAHAISPDGLIVGASDTASGDEHAFLWKDGAMIDLGTLGGQESSAVDISARQLVYGMADTVTGESHAVVWSASGATDLGTLGGDASVIYAANGNGLAVGQASRADGTALAAQWRDAGAPEALQPADAAPSAAVTVNDAGASAGTIELGTERARAAIWSGGTRILLPSLGEGVSQAFGITNQGVAAGRATDREGRTRAVLWVPVGVPLPAALSSLTSIGARVAKPAPLATPVASPVAAIPCHDAVQSDAATKTRTLFADCVTDRALFVPDGWAFDGGGHTIAVVDPDNGPLTRGVILVTGDSGSVRDVVIDGAGLRFPCIIDRGKSSLAGVRFEGASGHVSGVTVRDLRRSPPAATRYQNGQSVRESCGAGIAVLEAGAMVDVEANVVENVGYAGILVEEAGASIMKNRIERAADTGILALRGAHVRITPGNEIRDSAVGIQFESAGTGGRIAGNTIGAAEIAGIVIAGGAEASIAGNQLSHSGENGIAIEGATSRATVEENQIEDSDGVGIELLFGNAQIEGNTISGGQFGISVGNGATGTVTRNAIRRPERVGIVAFQDGTTVTIDGNAVDDSAQHGIWVEQGARAEITGNTVNRAARVGIGAYNGAVATISGGNAISGARFGITAYGAGTSATVEENVVSSIEQTGYTVEDGASAQLRRNRASETDWGILVTDEGTTAELAENRIVEPGGIGIALVNGSGTTATGNIVTLPGKDGIWATGAGTTATINGSQITGATETGIKVAGAASATIGEGNLITASRWGISVLDAGTSATIDGNTIEGIPNDGVGVEVLQRARARISGNTISGAASGVLVQEGGRAVVEKNTIRDAGNTGIWYKASPPGGSGPVELRTIHARDIYFDPKSVSIPAETDVTFAIQNDGAAVHSFVIDALDVRVELKPGERKQVTINAPAGRYDYRCDIPGHTEAGMVGTLIAVGDAAIPGDGEDVQEAIRGNVIEGGKFGIVVKGGDAEVVVVENRVKGAAQTGISIEDEATADLTRNIVSGGTAGINVARAGTSATLTGNQIEATKERGIVVQLGADAELHKNVVTQAGADGIVVTGKGTVATLEGNIVSNAAETGIQAALGARATIGKGNLVTGGKWGISILSDGTTAEVRGSRVVKATNQGITVLYGARATIDGNSVSGGASGIYLSGEESRATITGNFVSSAERGISVLKGGTGERIAKNRVSQSDNGIVVEGSGTTADVSENRISDPRGYGFQFSDGAHVTASDNEIVGAGVSGIRVFSAQTEVELEGNSVRDAKSAGIEVSNGQATISGNTIAGSANTGIRLGGGAAVTVTGNTIVGPSAPDTRFVGAAGIRVFNGVHGVVTGNTISGHVDPRPDFTGCGIEVHSGVEDLQIAENRFPPPGNERDFCDERQPAPAATPLATPVAMPLATPVASP
jgi:probable HAF family extracellular repeat protein/parallel beta-helix repeat protein